MFCSFRVKIVPFFLSLPAPVVVAAVTSTLDAVLPTGSPSFRVYRTTSGPKSVPAKLPPAKVSSTSCPESGIKLLMVGWGATGADCELELDDEDDDERRPLEAAATGGRDDMKRLAGGGLPPPLGLGSWVGSPARLRYVDLLLFSSSLDSLLGNVSIELSGVHSMRTTPHTVIQNQCVHQ
uniref:(northern house mosquito) hypothetical protein n=1 Tax=Culex pipiens TaxID=7175 RepID=A0A8D7ZXS0_CULPI